MMVMTWSRLAIAFPAAAAFIALAGAPAFAQIGQSDAPVEITSQQGEYLQNEGRGVYTGNVVATQGESQIKTDKLTVICSKSPEQGGGAAPSCDELEVLVAEGNVFYSAPDVRIRGSKAEYDFPSDTITITGDVILSRGEDGVVRGTRVIYSIGEGRTVITAGEKRVITVFNTAKKAAPATPATPPAQPAPTQN
jgi:lipopolysaccharide export system protein LptA